MNREARYCTPLFLLLFAMATKGEDTIPPRPRPGNPTPLYPTAAYERRVEGTVTFQCEVDERGHVTAVRILDVPREGIGFEQSVERAVTAWQFEPARRGGEAVASSFNGKAEFFRHLPYDRARMFPLPSQGVWSAIEELIKDLGLDPGIDQVDARAGVIVTDWGKFLSNPERSPPLPRVSRGRSPRQFRFHVFVPQFAQPARVYIDPVFTARTGLRTSEQVYYQVGSLSEWLFEKLETRLGKEGLPIPDSFARRQRLAEKLLGPDEVTRLGGPVPEDLLIGSPIAPNTLGLTEPNRIAASFIRPLYPYNEQHAHQVGKVLMTAVVSEDGRVTDLRVVRETLAESEFTVAAREAVALWRYVPARKNEWAVPVDITIVAEFAQ